MRRLICVIFILSPFFIVRSVQQEERNEKEIDGEEKRFFVEHECAKAGGICIDRVNCAPEKVSYEGHCPKQKNFGAVCCHGLSSTETKCQNLGGHCISSCPKKVVIAQAQDCEEKVCCPLTD